MKTTAGQKVKIGVFTIAGILLLLIGIFVIGSKKNMFNDTFSIYGTFKNVGGLQIGNNVRFAGINVGTVDGIRIVNDSTVRVNMRLQTKVRPFLKNDALASIGSDGLMGDKLVTISPGETGDQLLAEGEQILTRDPTDFDKIIARISNVVNNAESVTASLASIGTQISGGKGSLGKLIYTDSLERGLVGTVRAAKETMKSAKKGTEGFSENMEALKHNFLFKGYYKKKAKAQRKEEAADTAGTDNTDIKPTKKQLRKEAREEKKQQKQEAKEDKNQPAATPDAK